MQSVVQTQFSSLLTGIFFAFLSAGLFAIVNVTVRLSAPYFTVWHIMFGRSLIGAILMILLSRGITANLLGQDKKTLFLVGIAGVGGLVCLMGSLLLLPLFEALALIYLYPAFSALLSPYLTNDRTEWRDWLFIATAFTGTLLIIWTGDANFHLQIGHFIGLLAAFGYGLMLTLIRRVSGKNSPFAPFFYICIVGIAVCWIPVLFQEPAVQFELIGILFLVVIAVLGASGLLAGIKALEYISSTRVGVIGMSELIFGGILGFLIFYEPVTLLDCLGGVIIITSNLLLNIKSITKGETVTEINT